MPRTAIPLAGGNNKVAEHNFYDFRAMARTTGNIWFVDSGASASGSGLSPEDPVTTIDAAVNLCTANNGDVVFVMEGHAETLTAAAGIDADVAGITIWGLGSGTVKPTVTLGTATTTDVDIDAANVTLRNLRFVCNIDSLAAFLDVNEGQFLCEDCDFVTSSAKEAVCFADIATTKDFFTFRNCTFIQPTDPAGTDGDAGTGCFYFVDSEYLFFENCFFDGAFETAIWHNKTTAATNVWIRDCWGRQSLTGAEVFVQVANMSGGIHNSLIIVVGATDVMEANVTGTLAANFFVSTTTSFGNDGGGGQGALKVAGDAS